MSEGLHVLPLSFIFDTQTLISQTAEQRPPPRQKYLKGLFQAEPV